MKNASLLIGGVLIVALMSHANAEERTYGTIDGWGSMIDPDGDCTFVVGADRVGLQVPATPHDLSAELNRMNAPRVLQLVEGDFELEVRVSGILQPDEPTIETRTAYAGAGLVIMRDEANYIRLERAALRLGESTRNYTNFEQRQKGQVIRFGRVDDLSLEADESVRLKLIRTGTTVTGLIHTGEGDWQALGKKSISEGGKLFAGIAAINATNAPLNAKFRNLQLTRVEQAPADAD